MTPQRRLQVLGAIVQDYVSSREPVGSRALVDRHNPGVSPATIRNDMAVLEEEGYITQPHTSAGRIPTDKGYRKFVDQISEVKPLSQPERRAISELLEGAVDLDELLERTVRLLAQLTQQVAVVQYPSLRRSALQHIEFVPLGGQRLMVVIIAATGRVAQRVIESDRELDEALLAELRARVNAEVVGINASHISGRLNLVREAYPPSDHALINKIAAVIEETLKEDVEERFLMAGTANLARATIDFPRTISPVLEALEEQVVMLRLLTEMSKDVAPAPPAVRIGHENHHQNLTEASVVATGYGDAEGIVGQLGILGPTRMDYPTTMASVRAVARYLSRFMSG